MNRTGHFWEKRYHSTGFPVSDKRRALNTLRYIHGNPKAAHMQQEFFYDFSNYGIYDRLTQDGLSQWHPAFLQLGICVLRLIVSFASVTDPNRNLRGKPTGVASCWQG